MSDLIEELKLNVQNIKNDIYDANKKNDNGYYEVTEQNVTKCIFECLQLIRTFILTNKIQIEDKAFIDSVLKFENLETDFIWDKLVNKFNKKEHQYWSGLNSLKPEFPLILNSCIFKNLSFNAQTHTTFINNLEIHNCNVASAFFSSNGINLIDSAKFSETNFLKLQLAGQLRAPIQFDKCSFVSEFSVANNTSFSESIKFKSCIFFRATKGSGLQSHDAIFNNAEFLNTTEFVGCKFYGSPKFHGVKFHSDTSFHRSKFHDVKSPSAVGDYRTLKQSMNDLGAEHDSMIFHALEMESRRNTILPEIWKFWHPKWHETFASWFLKLTTNYGRNFWLPCIWLLISLFVYTTIYKNIGGVGCNIEKLDGSDLWMKDLCVPEIKEGYKINLMYSFQRFWGPLGLIFDSGLLSPKTFGIKLISISQFILSSVLWFILIVQIRRQFRL